MELKYHHALACKPFNLYEIIKWLLANFDPVTWDVSPNRRIQTHVVFYFKNEADLNWFLLRWGG